MADHPGFHSLHDEAAASLSVEGSLPAWLTGSLVRNGPGAFSFPGGSTVDHWFDGLAMLYRFTFDPGGGKVHYRNRFLRTDAYEARLPATADTVVAIASAHVVGEPLSEELVHRVPEVGRITGLEPGEEITAAAVADVLASDRGGRKDVPSGATYVPLLNMVDDADLEANARRVATEIHDRIDVPRVVLAEMRAEDPVVDVV